MSVPRLGLIVAPRALGDFRGIRLYGLREWGEERTAAYQSVLTGGFERLRDHQRIGVERDDLEDGLRAWHVERHVIFYRIRTDVIQIARILHERADPTVQQFR